MGRKLSSIVRANMNRRPTLSEQPRQAMEHVIGPQTPFDFDCQALARELVDLPETPWKEWTRTGNSLSSRGVATMLKEFDIMPCPTKRYQSLS